MSSRGDGDSGGGGGGLAKGSRVSISDNAKQTIQKIREITGKQHSDEEIYVTLKECSMDPNETAQKLLYMDAGGGRNAFTRRDYGLNCNADKVKNNAPPRRTRSPIAILNGTGSLPNGSSSHGRGPQSSIDNATSETKDGLPVNKPTTDEESPTIIPVQSFSSLLKGQEKSASNLNAPSTSTISPAVCVVNSPASSDPVSAPTVSRPAGDIDAIKPEVAHQQVAAEINHNKHVPRDIDVSEVEKTVSEVLISMHAKEEPDKSKVAVAEQVRQPKIVQQGIDTSRNCGIYSWNVYT